MKFLDRPAVHIFLIALLGLLAYSNTFDVPFQFDDENYIVTNPLIKAPDIRPQDVRGADLNVRYAIKTRIIGFLSFWANYKANGLEVAGYHAVNLSIHIINGLLVYVFVLLIYRTPFMGAAARQIIPPLGKGAEGGIDSGRIALLSALLFVSHPVQTQSVTYISQRFASLVALFYLGSLVFYIKWRLATEIASLSARKDDERDVIARSGATKQSELIFFFLLSILFAVLAMHTKENAFTLPLVLALIELMFFSGALKKRLISLAPFALTMAIIPYSLMTTDVFSGDLNRILKSQTEMPRLDYLFTELRVMATYLRLLVLPVNQNLDYDYPLYSSLLSPGVFLPLLLHLSLIASGIYLLKGNGRFRGNGPARPARPAKLIAFGIFWFYLTLSVESSFIPIVDVINEQRVYLPSVGAFSAFGAGAVLLLRGIKGGRTRAIAYIAVSLIPLILTYASFERNTIWKSRISLWEDVIGKSPGKARGHNNLGNAYRAEGLNEKALEQYLTAVRLNPDHVEAHNNLGIVYASMDLADRAIEHYRAAIRLAPDCAEAHNNLGLVFSRLGLVSSRLGLTDEAIGHYREALRINPHYMDAHINLGLAYLSKGEREMARSEFISALGCSPESHKSRLFLNKMISDIEGGK